MRVHSGNLRALQAVLVAATLGMVWVPAGRAQSQTSQVRRPSGAPAPTSHPRLWLTPERVANIREKACRDDNGSVVPGCLREKRLARFMDELAPYGYWGKEAWHDALAWVVTGNPQYALDAVAVMDTAVVVITNEDRGQGNFLRIASNMRSTALVYDWCYDFLTSEQRATYRAYMNQLMTELWNPFDNETHLWSGWAVEDPGNNFYYSFLTATCYVALATWGENPSAPQLTFNGTTYPDLIDFVRAKIDEQVIPLYLNTWGKGGAWHEGNNYGVLSKRMLLETLLMIRDVEGTNYFRQIEWPKEVVRYHLYSMQPGFLQVYPGGDLPQLSQPYDRALMLLAADGLQGTAEGEYAQFFSNHIETSEDWDYWEFLQPWDVLFFYPRRPGRDFTELPPCYFAEGGGWLNSRSGWGDDAVSVSFVCTNRIQGHQAQDQNAFLIYKDGFRATHGNLHSLWGIYQATDAFNTILVGGTGQAYGGDWDTPTETVHDIGIMPRCELASDYVYAVGDASDAYYTNAGQFGHGEDRLLEVFTRELVHLVPDLVVVYDRVIPVDPADTPTWMLHTAEQPVLSGTQLQASDGAQRLENWSLLPAGGVIDTAIHPGGSTYGSPDTLTSWRTTIEPPQSEKENYFLNVLRVSDQGSSDVVTVSPVGSLFEDLVGARIATAEKAWVILFTTGADAVAPVSVARYTDSSDRRDDHVVFGMTPGASYDIQVKKEKDGLAYRVTIVPGTAVTASLQGTLRFTMDAFLPGDTDVTPEDPPASRTYRFALRANHPNPFNPSTTIAFELPEASPVELSVFDARGAHVVTLVEGVRAAGPHEISWNGHNTEGRAVGSGVYFYRLRAGSRSATRKMVLLK